MPMLASIIHAKPRNYMLQPITAYNLHRNRYAGILIAPRDVVKAESKIVLPAFRLAYLRP